MTFWTYILRCADGSYYTGHTDDLERRIGQHQTGEIPGYTHDRRPVELMWSQDFGTRLEALEAERRIKGWSRAKKEALASSDWATLSELAVPPSERALRLRSGRTEEVSALLPTEGLDTLPPMEGVDTLPSTEGADTLPPTGGMNTLPPTRGLDTPPPFVLSEVEAQAPTVSPPFVLSEVEAHVPPPVIVLVRPQLGENIGKAARAMLNFGLVDLRLVAPRDGWPNPQAGPAASGADVVLEKAHLYDTVADAVADCAHVYATTVRKRGITKPVVTPEAAGHAIHAGPGRSAILFGPERSGLETDDVAVARTIVTVPINPEFGSLNLAQAVILVAYEWSKGVALAQPPETELPPPAPQGELDGLIGQLDAMLEDAHFFFPPSKTETTKRTLRTLLTKPGWSSQEVRTVRGVLSALRGAKARRAEGSAPVEGGELIGDRGLDQPLPQVGDDRLGDA